MKQRSALFAVPLIIITCGAAIPAPARAQAPGYVLTAKPARRIEGVCTTDVTYPKFKASEWIVFSTAAPELPSQQKVSTKLSPEGKAGTELSDLKRPIVSAKVTADKKQQSRLQYTVTYQATLMERKLVPLLKGKQPPKVDPLSDGEKTWYVAATTTFYDYKAKPFQAWLDKHGLRTKAGEGEVDFARRVFLVIAKTCSYEAKQSNDRHASAVCEAGKSDCGGMSVLFIATMRANGVPARSLVGNWTNSSKPGEVVGDIPFTQQHVRAEFFAPGVGWVPVDQSAALFLKAKPTAMLQQCFGYDAGNFFVKQIDYDLILDTGESGKQTVPWTWCTAYPIGEGELTSAMLKDDWKVRVLR